MAGEWVGRRGGGDWVRMLPWKSISTTVIIGMTKIKENKNPKTDWMGAPPPIAYMCITLIYGVERERTWGVGWVGRGGAESPMYQKKMARNADIPHERVETRYVPTRQR